MTSDRVLIYFAGHGMECDGADGSEGYLPPQHFATNLNTESTFQPARPLSPVCSQGRRGKGRRWAGRLLPRAQGTRHG